MTALVSHSMSENKEYFWGVSELITNVRQDGVAGRGGRKTGSVRMKEGAASRRKKDLRL